jgi:hypothetical protein
MDEISGNVVSFSVTHVTASQCLAAQSVLKIFRQNREYRKANPTRPENKMVKQIRRKILRESKRAILKQQQEKDEPKIEVDNLDASLELGSTYLGSNIKKGLTDVVLHKE